LLRSEPQKGLIRRIVLNRLHDIENQKQILLTLGWKHMCPPRRPFSGRSEADKAHAVPCDCQAPGVLGVVATPTAVS
jgi:hypothetical protein